MKRYAVLVVLILLLLSGCEAERRAIFKYYSANGGYIRTVYAPVGHILDDGHSYDLVETEVGYDITFHLRRDE